MIILLCVISIIILIVLLLKIQDNKCIHLLDGHTNKIGIASLIFILLIIWFNLHIIKKSKNITKHLGSKHKYAHFSKIDKVNYLWYPRLLFTNPLYFTTLFGFLEKIT